MDIIKIIDTYYLKDNKLRNILLTHSRQVADFALEKTRKRSLLVDQDFVYQAAMLHDIGIFMTYAPGIHCFGDKPYLCHGYLGAELLRREGFSRHALVCERHTGAGISKEDILSLDIPIPYRDMIPTTLEEKLICFADAFFSKNRLGEEKSIAEARKGIARYSNVGAKRFDDWCELFL